MYEWVSYLTVEYVSSTVEPSLLAKFQRLELLNTLSVVANNSSFHYTEARTLQLVFLHFPGNRLGLPKRLITWRKSTRREIALIDILANQNFPPAEARRWQTPCHNFHKANLSSLKKFYSHIVRLRSFLERLLRILYAWSRQDRWEKRQVFPAIFGC